jgi:hypothetical protein
MPLRHIAVPPRWTVWLGLLQHLKVASGQSGIVDSVKKLLRYVILLNLRAVAIEYLQYIRESARTFPSIP